MSREPGPNAPSCCTAAGGIVVTIQYSKICKKQLINDTKIIDCNGNVIAIYTYECVACFVTTFVAAENGFWINGYEDAAICIPVHQYNKFVVTLFHEHFWATCQ